MDPQRLEPQRLLPQSLEDRLLRWLGRLAGAALLAALVVAWASLVSWSVADPSLTHATAAEPQNWVGPAGAILSDLMLQTLGFAAVVALIAPLIWTFDLFRRASVHDGRLKFGFYPLSILALAGALSALPAFDAWPLHHGVGGALGDGLFKVVASMFAMVNAERAGLAAAIILSGAAASMFARSTGFAFDAAFRSGVVQWRNHRSQRSALRALRPQREPSERTSQLRRVWPSLKMRMSPKVVSAGFERSRVETSTFAASQDPTLPPLDWRGEDSAPQFADYLRAQEPAPSARSERAMTSDFGGQAGEHHDLIPSNGAFEPAEISPGDDAHQGMREPSFDEFTDAESRAIAVRFAPGAPDTKSSPAFNQVSPPKSAKQKPAAVAAKSAASDLEWKRPSLNFLKRAAAAKPGPEFSQAVMRGNARLLEDVLADFGVKGEVKAINPGPVVTLYELEPARGVKSSRVIGLADDIARSMSLASVRAAVVPGRNAIGLELPNVRREPVLLREIFESDAYRASEAALPLALGKSIAGTPIVVDLARMPHLLVAGTTGSGKSVGVNAMVLSLLYRCSPDDCRLLMIDPKMLELSVYNGIPHLLTPVVTDPHKAVAALNWAVMEMEERYKRMSALAVRNIDVFNNRVRNAKKHGERLSRRVQTGFDAEGRGLFEDQKIRLETLPHIVIVVDEFADLMMVAGKDVEAAVQRLAQMARAAGIHLIMATQRPSVDVLTGTIKANFPTRISFKVTSKIDSRTILNEQGAEQLLGQGDMLYSSGAGQFMRVHGAFVADEEVEAIAESLRRQRPPDYIPGILDAPTPEVAPGLRDQNDGDLFDRAVAIVMRDRKASTSYLQRRLSIGYNRAADLIERMEREGMITAANTVGKREILLPPGDGEDH
ncbi:MAG: DNA translocase FtsK 4TM domain-containing protein [Hyphomicrobium sp.]